MIRIDAVWLAVSPIDMRTDVDRLLASVVQVFGAAQAPRGYVFVNARSSRIRLLLALINVCRIARRNPPEKHQVETEHDW